MRNVKLLYILNALWFSWFWVGIWLFYYLRFTNYSGIGLIEGIMMILAVTAEIPSGAIADLFGKKFTLSIAFFVCALGSALMGLAQNFSILVISVLLITLGQNFYSGTFEALAYDSLLEEKKEKRYFKIISNLKTVQFIFMAIASILGGYLYKINPGLPFIICGVLLIIGLIITLFLKEPIIDSNKFSLKTFINQNIQGIKQLFSSNIHFKKTILLLFIALILVICYQVLDEILLFEFGLTETQMSWSISGLYLFAALISKISNKLPDYLTQKTILLTAGFGIAISLLLSPIIGIIFGIITVFLRVGFEAIFDNSTSTIINNMTESKYRATTLSTFAMLKNIPYMVLAFWLGALMDLWSAKVVAGALGAIMLIFVSGFFFMRNSKTVSSEP